MGHVDHGKTSLLDAIRHTGIAAHEAGGITQHIGASQVKINGRQITFVDTPGHEAFTAMRARGAKITDVVVLVVAADDGVMPQTVEAINHSKAAGVPIVVAVNKCDKPDANPDRVRQELVEYGVIPEEWGGSEHVRERVGQDPHGIDDLLETILLQADVLELKANPDTFASGYIIEAKLDRGRGPVATVLVNRGTLHVGDALVAGTCFGRVRAMLDQHGDAQDRRHALRRRRDPGPRLRARRRRRVPRLRGRARRQKLADERALKARIEEQDKVKHVTLETLFSEMNENELKELNLVVKADVQGSIEALADALGKMDQSEVRINIIHSAVGAISETDVILAAASNAIIVGFGVRPQAKARDLAERENVQIKTYSIIYKAIEDIDAARIGMLKPTEEEVQTGAAEVRETLPRAQGSASSPAAWSPRARSPATTRSASCATASSCSTASSPRCAASRTTSRPCKRRLRVRSRHRALPGRPCARPASRPTRSSRSPAPNSQGRRAAPVKQTRRNAPPLRAAA